MSNRLLVLIWAFAIPKCLWINCWPSRNWRWTVGVTLARKLAAQMAKAMAAPPTLVLMHSDAPLMRRVAAELGLDATRKYHEGNSNLALKPSRAVLKRAGVAFEEKESREAAAEAIRCFLVFLKGHAIGKLEDIRRQHIGAFAHHRLHPFGSRSRHRQSSQRCHAPTPPCRPKRP